MAGVTGKAFGAVSDATMTDRDVAIATGTHLQQQWWVISLVRIVGQTSACLHCASNVATPFACVHNNEYKKIYMQPRDIVNSIDTYY